MAVRVEVIDNLLAETCRGKLETVVYWVGMGSKSLPLGLVQHFDAH